MVELTVLSAVMVLFKAVFAGEDLDRNVGADIISTLVKGLLRTTSPTDPVLLQVYEMVKEIKGSAYEDAMTAGHRYLSEATLGSGLRVERLKLAREQLVLAASAAVRMKLPLLQGNAELAIAKCDALLAAPDDAAMALDRAAATLEQAIEKLDVSRAGHVWRQMRDAKSTQNDSVSKWLTRLTEGGLVRQRELDAAAKTADDMQAELANLTTLYSEVQTAILARSGHAHPVVWTQPQGESVRTGLDAKAVATVSGDAPVRGFGLTLLVQRQNVWQTRGGGLVASFLLSTTADDERRLDLSHTISLSAPALVGEVRSRGLSSLIGASHPGAGAVAVPKGDYNGIVTLPLDSPLADKVRVRIARPENGVFRATGGCVYIPISRQ